MKTTVTRRQIFPPQKTIVVEHEYAPILGGSVGGGLDPQYRRDPDGFAAERAKFCIDADWLKSFDAKAAKRKNSVPPYSEVWLGYVLKTAARARPDRRFPRSSSKGRRRDRSALVSFCGEP